MGKPAEQIALEGSRINSLTLCVPRPEAKLLIRAMFKLLGVQDNSKTRMVFCNNSSQQDYGGNVSALRFSSWGPSWPRIVDAENNLAPAAFKLLRGYHIRCAALALARHGIVFVGLEAIQIVKAPIETPPFQFEPVEGGFRFTDPGQGNAKLAADSRGNTKVRVD